ncbi:AbrB/MazE/SpoVT family DNA-binding domain-containing protein [Paenibacillus rhizophilus]|uniref:AbrB/MazE/SpoVT family DNA-binding domain-containing protein n=1 Tax=Paenibacillus rhizophilus TaxID=1850366 RepID=A0A3N9NYP0_9BACL|nr:AbrB/MazE/SpoVT family DNA-binding domain-containing protein [Paenibacillus rhizophilus]
MKDTGMIRSLDNLGRIVVPVEIRMTRNIDIGDPIEFFILDDHIIVLRKYTSTECTFCRSLDNVTYFKDQFICSRCLQELVNPGLDDRTPEQEPDEEAHVPSSDLYAGKKKTKSDELRDRLEQTMQEHPAANQKELAVMLGISQARVSQLKRKFANGR